MIIDPASLRLDGRQLGRAWWRLPVQMIVILIALAYLVAGLCRIPNLGGWWPLLIGGGFGLVGMLNGYAFNGRLMAMLGQRAGVAYLPADHAVTRRVHALAARIGLPAPKVGIMRGLNAYASGPDQRNAVVVIGLPLIQRLTSDELDAVIGHELGHIATGDMRRMQYGSGFQRMFSETLSGVSDAIRQGVRPTRGQQFDISMLAPVVQGFAWVGRYVIGLVGELLLMASSRTREYHADAIGAALTSPAAMIRALEKVHRVDAPPTKAETDFAYMMFRGFGGQAFSTHPTLEQRRKALEDGGYIRALPVLPSARPASPAASNIVTPAA